MNGSISGWSAEDLRTQEFRVGDSVVRTVRHKHVGGIEAGHPAVYPVSLPRELIASYSDIGDTIADPFCGSGSTGIACIKLGRKFIGIEIEERYHSIACRRIEAAYRQPDFFVQPAEKPVQPALFEEQIPAPERAA